MPGMCKTRRDQLLTSCGRHQSVGKPTVEWVPACHGPGCQVVVETKPSLRNMNIHALRVRTRVRSGRSIPLPAEERNNKPADAEEAQSCRGLDDSCLSNIIILHGWLVPARHHRLLHRSTASPATLKLTTRQALPRCTEHVH